jgi:hypothetical protein
VVMTVANASLGPATHKVRLSRGTTSSRIAIRPKPCISTVRTMSGRLHSQSAVQLPTCVKSDPSALAFVDQYAPQPGTSGPHAPPQSAAASAFRSAVVSCICAMLFAARNCWYCW